MSKRPDAKYRGHTFQIRSYKSDGGRWRPRAVVVMLEGGEINLKTVNAPLAVLFDTEAQADAHTLVMAKKWIDDHA